MKIGLAKTSTAGSGAAKTTRQAGIKQSNLQAKYGANTGISLDLGTSNSTASIG